MDYKSKLTDFIDGTLNPEDEQQLFAELTYNDSLREDMKSYMTIDKTIKAGAESFTPSSAATNNVFAALGYTLPAAAVLPQAAAAKTTAVTSGKVLTGIGAGIGGSIFTLIAVFFLLDSGIADKEIVYIEKSVPVVESVEDVAAEAVIPFKESSKNIESGPVFPIYASISNEAQRTAYNDKANSTAIPDLSNRKVVPENRLENQAKNRIIEIPAFANNTNYNFHYNAIDFYNKKGFSIEVKNHEAWHLPEHTISPGEMPVFSHSGLSLLYKLSDTWDIGASLRRENFYLEYKGSENDIDYDYFQQPNFVSYGFLTRYNTGSIYFLKPFLQTELGGNKYGYLGRLSLGSEIDLYNDFSMIISLESGLFLFKHDNKWFSSKKIGFEYGIKYSF